VHGHAVPAARTVIFADDRDAGTHEVDVVVNLLPARFLGLVGDDNLPVARFRHLPTGVIPILRHVETPEFFDVESPGPPVAPERYPRPAAGGIWAAGERITWVCGLLLAVSAFTDWYAGSGVGVKLAVIGWHTGVLGKLVFFVGLAVLALVALREAGFELPPTVPESLLVLGLGALALIFVLIRLISIPDSVLPADGRGIGIYISLLAALGVVLGGLLRAAEEL
jgi:hypothetical protein